MNENRNYKKEYTLAMQKIMELQELVFAYQAIADDLDQQLKKMKGNSEPTQ